MLLGSSKTETDALLGSPIMAASLLDMTTSGEKTFSYTQGADSIIVGFFDDVARYMAVIQSLGPRGGFTPAEMASILSLNAPSAQWKKETAEESSGAKTPKRPDDNSSPPSNYYSLNDPKRKFEILGWEPGGKPFTFFFTPSWPGQLPIVLNEWQVAKAIG